MANWTKLGNGTWGVQTTQGTTGDRVTVTRANGTTSTVTLGSFVKRTRWGRVFAVAGRTAPARRRPARRRRRPDPTLTNLRSSVARTVPTVPTPPKAVTAPVSTPEPVDPSVARFRLLDLSDDPTEPTPEPVDDGPGRQLIID